MTIYNNANASPIIAAVMMFLVILNRANTSHTHNEIAPQNIQNTAISIRPNPAAAIILARNSMILSFIFFP